MQEKGILLKRQSLMSMEINFTQNLFKYSVVNSVPEFRRDLQLVLQKVWKHRAILAGMKAAVEEMEGWLPPQ